MKVMKFGGTSVGKPQRMHDVAKLITADSDEKIVVLSAVSGTTNALVEISNLLSNQHKKEAQQKIAELKEHYIAFAHELVSTAEGKMQANEIIKEHFEFLNIILKISFSESLQKDILAQGELLSTKLFSTYLTEKGIEHELLPALDFMSLDRDNEPQIGTIKVKLSQILKQHKTKKLFITQGFICRNTRGEVDNLKRGGSDYTASLIAAAVNASVCEIWTDIDGMHNNDPRFIKNTTPVYQLSFDEAAELAYFGAKILHPASIWPAQHYNIPVKLLNTMQPDAKGTTIVENASDNNVKAVVAKDNIISVNIKSSRMLLAYGFLRKIFEVFEKHRTSIDMITTSEVAVSVTIDDESALQNITAELEAFGKVTIEKQQSIVSIVGNEIADNKSLLQKTFNSLNEVDVRMVSFGGSKHNVTLLIPQTQKQQALQQLHTGLFG